MATKTYYEPKEEAVPWLVGIDMQKFICGYGANFIGSSYVSCVGIGCQPQWGFEETETKTIAFPISFESIKYVFLSKIYGPASGGADTVAYNFFRKSLTGVSFDYAYTRNWLAIGGKQPQWGFTNNTGRPYITFPFKFSNVFTAISCICHNGSPSEANTVYNVSISGMNIGASGGGSGKYWCAFGVAQQQWGYSNSTGVTFPIAFRECYAVVSNAHSNTTGNTDHYHLLSWTATGAAFGYWNMSFYGTLYIALGVE